MYKNIHAVLCVTLLLAGCAVSTSEPATTPPPSPIPSPTPAPLDRAGWSIVWQDEFEGAELDTTNWTFDLGGSGWGNAEWEVYTDQPENVRVEDGMLVIEARKDPNLPAGRAYSSARIKTQGLHAWQYGRIEARMKLPSGQGIWLAFWMLGANNKGWPASGEIDILEYTGKTPDRIFATVHAPGYSGRKGVGTKLMVSADTLKNDFHVYAIEWQENEIRWFFDDQEFFRLTPADVPDEWIFDHDFFIIMNVAIGGGFAGSPDKTTIFPQFLYVDYVRVYQGP